jgi:TolB-like protein/Tfp pilus assembly protein PilF
MVRDVFVSYSQPDRDVAFAIVSQLETHGISVWIAPRDVAPSAVWAEAIMDALANARLLVLVFSSHSNDSVQVGREVERAVARHIPVLPFRIEDVPPSRSLEYFLSSQQWLDAFSLPRESHYAALCAHVAALLRDTSAAQADVPAAGTPRTLQNESRTSAPRALSSHRKVRSAGIGVAALLILGFGYFLVERFHAGTVAQPAKVAAAGYVPSIAVLPFVNMSADREQDYFADGLTEELSNQLGRLQGLRVVGRTSAFAFKGKNEDLRAISSALGVDHLLEGSVRRSNENVRVTAQLVDSRDGSQLWSATYERKLGDIFALQEELSAAVAGALSDRLVQRSKALQGTLNVQAYEAYLTGTARSRLGSEQQPRAIADLERAVALDPQYVLAWSRLAQVYGAMLPESEFLPKARRALSRALEIEPNSPLLQAQMTSMVVTEKRDWAALERVLRNALAATGGADFDANFEWGIFLLNVGRPRDAVAPLLQATRTEPLAQGASLLLHDAYFISGDMRAAEAEYDRGSALVGDEFLHAALQLTRGMALRNRGMIMPLLSRNASENAALIAGLDDPAVGIAGVRRWYEASTDDTSSVELQIQADWAAFFGDNQLALAALNKAYGPGRAPFAIWRPYMKSLRREPGFKDFLQKLRLLEYWRNSGKWNDFCHPRSDTDFECT